MKRSCFVAAALSICSAGVLLMLFLVAPAFDGSHSIVLQFALVIMFILAGVIAWALVLVGRLFGEIEDMRGEVKELEEMPSTLLNSLQRINEQLGRGTYQQPASQHDDSV